MDKVVVSIQLFIMQQIIYVYKDGKCTAHTFNSTINDLKDICYNLCKENNIHNLILKGHKFATSKIKQELITTNYDNFDLNIELVNE